MNYYPIFLDLRGKKCLVVGGGGVARRKAEMLLEARAKVTLISPHLTPSLRELKKRGKVRYLARKYRKGDTKGFFLAYDASADPRVHRLVVKEAVDNHVLINVVDRPKLCDFIAPAVVQRGNLVIAVSTGGASPAMARKVRQRLERIFGREYEKGLRLLSALRRELMRRSLSVSDRRRIFTELAGSRLLDYIREGKKGTVDRLLSRIAGKGWNLRKLRVRL
jgi:precorrin-2 dehydrogenase/sirohydrochlorin ferrochelatase